MGWPAPAALTPVTGGWDTLLWRFQTADGAAHALRVYRPDDGRDTRRLASLEALALRAAGRGGLATPAVEATGEDGDLSFLVLSWLPGLPMIDLLQTKPWLLWRLGAAFGRLQARLHRLPVPAELPEADPGAWPGAGDDQRLIAAVREAAVNDAFCHFDFHPANVLSTAREITGLIDFPAAARGDRRADIGRTHAVITIAPLPPSPLNPLLRQLRRQFAAAWRRGYQAEAGDFPLEPLFAAWGAATFLADIEDAVARRRGWAGPRDIEAVRRYVSACKRAAGVRATRTNSG